MLHRGCIPRNCCVYMGIEDILRDSITLTGHFSRTYGKYYRLSDNCVTLLRSRAALLNAFFHIRS